MGDADEDEDRSEIGDVSSWMIRTIEGSMSSSMKDGRLKELKTVLAS